MGPGPIPWSGSGPILCSMHFFSFNRHSVHDIWIASANRQPYMIHNLLSDLWSIDSMPSWPFCERPACTAQPMGVPFAAQAVQPSRRLLQSSSLPGSHCDKLPPPSKYNFFSGHICDQHLCPRYPHFLLNQFKQVQYSSLLKLS